MRSMLAVALATSIVVASALPSVAHEPTDYDDFLSTLVGGNLTPGATFLDIALHSAERADGLLEALLSTVPAPCYLDVYAASWLLYADYVHIADASDPDAQERAMVDLATRNSELPALIDSTDC